MKGRWIYFAAASLAGILAAYLKMVIFIIVISALGYLLYKRNILSQKQTILLFILFLLFFIRSEMSEINNKTNLTGDETLFLINITESVETDGDLLTAIVKERRYKEKLMVKYKIKTEKEKAELGENLKIGMACKVTGNLAAPPIATNPNAFNYKNYLNQNQIFWILEIDQLSTSSCVSEKTSLRLSLLKIREKGTAYLLKYFPENTAPLAIALIFGDRNFIDGETLQSYQKLGIIHLLAISGLHVGLLAGMFFFAGIRAGITREKMTAAIMLILPSYAIITGASPSVTRAVLMMLLVLLARKLKAPLLIIDVFAIVFILYTFTSPFIVYNAGFQLSFAVSLSLILSAPLILKRFTKAIAVIMTVSFVSQLSAAPILLWHFFEVSIISIFANVIFVPLFSILLLPAIFILFLLHLLTGGKAAFLLVPFDRVIGWIDFAAERLSSIPYTSIVLGRPVLAVLFLYILVIPVFFSRWEKSAGKKLLLWNASLPLFVLLIHFSTNALSPYGEVTFIDVGQGDSILIKLPYGRGNYLIDTGGTIRFKTEEWKERREPFETGKDTVVPFLKSKGIGTIDRLILTHGDMDHVGGAAAVIDELKVKTVMLPLVSEVSELEQEIIKKAKSKNVEVVITQAGDRWKEGSYLFQVLSPSEENEGEKNDGSIVLYTYLGGLSWLFTGDLEAAGEENLIKSYPGLRIDVLKAGHHGSKTSSTEAFLSGVEPQIAVMSAGKNNRYGHPHTEVLERLRDRKIRILRTDKQGAVSYIFKGNNGTFYVQLP